MKSKVSYHQIYEKVGLHLRVLCFEVVHHQSLVSFPVILFSIFFSEISEDAHTLQNYKVRRHTATQEELLFANSEENSMVSDANANPTVDVGADVGDSDERKEKKKRM